MSRPLHQSSVNNHTNPHTGTCTNDGSHSAGLRALANEIRAELDHLQEGDAIHECGKAALAILAIRPSEALQLAKDHVQNTPFRDVQGCWLRLYEDASLWRVAELLLNGGGDAAAIPVSTVMNLEGTPAEDDWMSRVVKILDLGLIISGATMRSELYEALFANLEVFVERRGPTEEPFDMFHIREPKPLRPENLVEIITQPSFQRFQLHLDNNITPLLLTNVMSDWPAMQTWQDPQYLLRLTLDGRRCVPVEIGETYTHVDWRQEIMPLHSFMYRYLRPTNPQEIGYLGQHNLFRQIPALQKDIRTPDYCYTAPPESTPASRLGLPPVPLVDEPQKNVWIGPKGTRTPLHTDPYHNIFCQVVGYKYVRLYPPEATESVYPRGVDENGINESNTSEVEIRLDQERSSNIMVEEEERFPLFLTQTDYREAIVGPGECLYIPAGWWHYIESLTTSYSVSFWWN